MKKALLFVVATFSFAQFHIFAVKEGSSLKCLKPPVKIDSIVDLKDYMRSNKGCFFVAKAFNIGGKLIHSVMFSNCKSIKGAEITDAFLKCRFDYERKYAKR
jgi:hypothetical protein